MLADNIETWEAVAADLRGVLRGLRDSKDVPVAAPLHHRLAYIRLLQGLIEDQDAVRRTLGPDHTGLGFTELEAHLRRQLDDDPDALPVVSALRPAVRAEAMLQLHEALQCDDRYPPALRAATALAMVSGRWNEVVNWLERLANAEPVERSVRPLVALAEVYWRKLGQPENARRHLVEARERAGDDPAVLDKLLKLDLDASNWEEAVLTCSTLIHQAGSLHDGQTLKVTYLLTLGEIHVYGLQRPAEALLHYLDALATMPEYALTYTLIRELLEANPWPAVATELAQVPEARRAPLAHLIERMVDGAKTHAENPEALVLGLRKALLGA